MRNVLKSSKWIWLGDKFEELGLPDFAEVAKEIEKSLLNIYGTGLTSKWSANEEMMEKCWDLRSTEKGKLEILRYVILNSSFCIACEDAQNAQDWKEDREPCNWCKFAKINGMCGDKGSAFSKLVRKVIDRISYLRRCTNGNS